MENTNELSMVSEIRISYKPVVKSSARPKVSSSLDCQRLLRPLFSELICHHEAFFVLLLDRSGKVMGHYKVSQGGTCSTVVDVKMIAQAAILSSSSAVVLCHNHPSGNKEPSADDLALTAQVKNALELFHIRTLDHIILTDEDYLSFADRGLI
ncbi:MAG: JAB domain-containing protein [Bacteroidota bacterium]